MGMFDTILLDPPIACPRCGSPMEIQTKLFDAVMQSYRIGDVVSPSPVLYGVLEEEAFCDACYKAKRETRTNIYLVVWHSILAGVELTLDAAQTRLEAVDRVDLIRWLDEAQKRETEWRRRFRSFYSDVKRWHDELERRRTETSEPAPEKSERARAFDAIFRLPEEILNAEDPFAEILSRHEDHSRDEDPVF